MLKSWLEINKQYGIEEADSFWSVYLSYNNGGEGTKFRIDKTLVKAYTGRLIDLSKYPLIKDKWIKE